MKEMKQRKAAKNDQWRERVTYWVEYEARYTTVTMSFPGSWWPPPADNLSYGRGLTTPVSAPRVRLLHRWDSITDL